MTTLPDLTNFQLDLDSDGVLLATFDARQS